MTRKTLLKLILKKSSLNSNAHLIKGKICGYRIAEMKNPFTRQLRGMGMLLDELIEGKRWKKHCAIHVNK